MESSTDIIINNIDNTQYWLDFFARILTSWPLMIIVVIVIFRNKISTLFEELIELNFKGLTFKFNKETNKAKQLFDSINSQNNDTLVSNVSLTDEQIDIINLNPRSAIESSWYMVEKSMYRLYLDVNPNSRKYSPPSANVIINTFRNKSLISNEEADFLHSLRKIRNAAVHEIDPDISKSDAEEYVRLTNSANNLLDRIKSKLSQ